MRGRHRPPRRPLGPRELVLGVSLGLLILVSATRQPDPAQRAATRGARDELSAFDPRVGPVGRAGRPVSQRRQTYGPPVEVVIPSIDVDARVVRLGLNPDRTLEVPTDFAEAGWWSGGTVPGERGPSVIVGHIDSKAGPAVFYRLRELERGDLVVVRGARGSVARFIVRYSEQVPKDAFPTERVYGHVPHAALRLITCGGAFDRSTGHYLDNLVVYARLAASSGG